MIRPRQLPLPKLLIDAAEDAKAPCLNCPHTTVTTAGREREWAYLTCERGWLPAKVAVASLLEKNCGSRFGRTIRKLTQLCPHIMPSACHRYMAIVCIDTTEPPAIVQARVNIMVRTLPFSKTVIFAVEQVK